MHVFPPHPVIQLPSNWKVTEEVPALTTAELSCVSATTLTSIPPLTVVVKVPVSGVVLPTLLIAELEPSEVHVVDPEKAAAMMLSSTPADDQFITGLTVPAVVTLPRHMPICSVSEFPVAVTEDDTTAHVTAAVPVFEQLLSEALAVPLFPPATMVSLRLTFIVAVQVWPEAEFPLLQVCPV